MLECLCINASDLLATITDVEYLVLWVEGDAPALTDTRPLLKRRNLLKCVAIKQSDLLLTPCQLYPGRVIEEGDALSKEFSVFIVHLKDWADFSLLVIDFEKLCPRFPIEAS